jgi:hypothetical protein
MVANRRQVLLLTGFAFVAYGTTAHTPAVVPRGEAVLPWDRPSFKRFFKVKPRATTTCWIGGGGAALPHSFWCPHPRLL